MKILGMISGTSYDGIDCSIGDFTIDGNAILLNPLFTRTHEYPAETYALINRSMPPAKIDYQIVCEIDTLIGQAFAEAAALAIKESGITPDLIVAHGQTMYHWISPEGKALGTLQVGDAARVAELNGIPVLSQLRSRDVAAGGQGAPFASLIDHMLLAARNINCGALNLGGISNMTVIRPGQDTVAFDVGPANALMDAAVRIYSDGSENFDRDGALGAQGKVNDAILGEMLKEPYYALSYPKSTGKELFNHDYLKSWMARYPEVSMLDWIATLTILTATTIANEFNKLDVSEVFVSGGGLHNKTLMAQLNSLTRNVKYLPYEDLGLSSDGKEAYLFALIGFLSMHNLPGNIPSSTGASGPRILGSLSPGKSGFPAVANISEALIGLRII
ncbi:MAG: anhydro-N-acetylmuramic acid kinase [Actinomycetes bacterium]